MENEFGYKFLLTCHSYETCGKGRDQTCRGCNKFEEELKKFTDLHNKYCTDNCVERSYYSCNECTVFGMRKRFK